MSDSSAFEPTIIFSNSPNLESNGGNLRASMSSHVGLAQQSVLRMADKTAVLLRRRLRIVAYVLMFGLTLFLIRGFLIGSIGMQIIHCTVFAATAVCIWETGIWRALPPHRLQPMEAILFGTVALQLVSADPPGLPLRR